MLSPTEIEEIKDFSRHLSDFPVLFKAYLIFKDFSRKPSKFKYFSSLCEPCKPKEKHNGSVHFKTFVESLLFEYHTGSQSHKMSSSFFMLKKFPHQGWGSNLVHTVL